MKSFQGITLAVFCVAFAFWAPVTDVEAGHADELEKVFNGLDTKTQSALNAIATPLGNGSLIGTLKQVINCIENEVKGVTDICNFNATLDIVYLIQKCAQGTLLQQILESIMQKIPVTELKWGIPSVISKDRCFHLTSVPSKIIGSIF